MCGEFDRDPTGATAGVEHRGRAEGPDESRLTVDVLACRSDAVEPSLVLIAFPLHTIRSIAHSAVERDTERDIMD